MTEETRHLQNTANDLCRVELPAVFRAAASRGHLALGEVRLVRLGALPMLVTKTK